MIIPSKSLLKVIDVLPAYLFKLHLTVRFSKGIYVFSNFFQTDIWHRWYSTLNQTVRVAALKLRLSIFRVDFTLKLGEKDL